MSDDRVGAERRESVRTKIPIEVEYAANSPPIKARLDDLSETGAFIDTHHALDNGTEMILTFSLPDENQQPQEIRSKGRVVWTAAMVGVGVEFVDLDEVSRERIRYFVASKLFGW